MISLIVAISPNYVIGKDNKIPWNIKEDMIHFKNYTLGKTVLMGKNTFLSIKKALPNRTNIVVCNDDISFKADNIILRKDLNEVLNEYKNSNEELVVIGGGSIYKYALPFCDKLVISWIKKEYEGDTYFPHFEDDFIVEKEEEFDKFVVKYYRRRNENI